MFALDHAMAQDIVDRAMAILPCNVNVMDYLCIIIGSGEAERLYTRHEGAQLMLAKALSQRWSYEQPSEPSVVQA
jgi:carbohydrate diacid regulator